MSTAYRPLDVGESVEIPDGDLVDWMSRLLILHALEAGGELRVSMAELRALEVRAGLKVDHDAAVVVFTARHRENA